MTKKLYEKDSYCREFKATVKSCEFEDGFYNIELSETAFFPEGGGQGSDIGFIDNIKVIDVQEKGDKILHKTKEPVPVGEEVAGKIDWDLRFSRMQSHAGEHIVSGIVHSVFGYSNVGFHMGEEVMVVDFDGPLSLEDIEKVELEANRAIYKNAPITVAFPSEDELKNLEYRSKKDIKEGIRIVTIKDIDACACCAPHPSTTGEIGVIKILDFCAYKQGTRIEMIAGINAVKDYMSLNLANKALMGLLSAPRMSVKDLVEKQVELAKSLKAENERISKELALFKLKPEKINNIVYSISKGLSYDELRHCANSLMEKGAEITVLLSESENGNYIYVVSSKSEDTRGIVTALNSSFNGKGGGKTNYAQGKISVENTEDIIKLLEEGV